MPTLRFPAPFASGLQGALRGIEQGREAELEEERANELTAVRALTAAQAIRRAQEQAAIMQTRSAAAGAASVEELGSKLPPGTLSLVPGQELERILRFQGVPTPAEAHRAQTETTLQEQQRQLFAEANDLIRQRKFPEARHAQARAYQIGAEAFSIRDPARAAEFRRLAAGAQDKAFQLAENDERAREEMEQIAKVSDALASVRDDNGSPASLVGLLDAVGEVRRPDAIKAAFDVAKNFRALTEATGLDRTAAEMARLLMAEQTRALGAGQRPDAGQVWRQAIATNPKVAEDYLRGMLRSGKELPQPAQEAYFPSAKAAGLDPKKLTGDLYVAVTMEVAENPASQTDARAFERGVLSRLQRFAQARRDPTANEKEIAQNIRFLFTEERMLQTEITQASREAETGLSDEDRTVAKNRVRLKEREREETRKRRIQYEALLGIKTNTDEEAEVLGTGVSPDQFRRFIVDRAFEMFREKTRGIKRVDRNGPRALSALEADLRAVLRPEDFSAIEAAIRERGIRPSAPPPEAETPPVVPVPPVVPPVAPELSGVDIVGGGQPTTQLPARQETRGPILRIPTATPQARPSATALAEEANALARQRHGVSLPELARTNRNAAEAIRQELFRKYPGP